MDKISESGLVGADGRLRMPMDRLNAFFAKHKGQRVIVRFEAAPVGTTDAQKAYFYQYVLPTVQEAFRQIGERMTTELTELTLFAVYPGTPTNEKGEMIMNARQLTKTQMSDFLEWLKQYAAENLYVYIEDPKTL